jgi:hypothetical protein
LIFFALALRGYVTNNGMDVQRTKKKEALFESCSRINSLLHKSILHDLESF